MMNTVRHTFHSLGDRSGELARSIGSGTADLARRVSNDTTTLAKRIGPRRALIGLAVAAIAIGGSALVIRYLRTRRAREGDGPLREQEATAESISRSTDLPRAAGAEAPSPY